MASVWESFCMACDCLSPTACDSVLSIVRECAIPSSSEGKAGVGPVAGRAGSEWMLNIRWELGVSRPDGRHDRATLLPSAKAAASQRVVEGSNNEKPEPPNLTAAAGSTIGREASLGVVAAVASVIRDAPVAPQSRCHCFQVKAEPGLHCMKWTGF